MISQPAVVLGVVRNEDGAVISDATVSIWKAGEAQSGFLAAISHATPSKKPLHLA